MPLTLPRQHGRVKPVYGSVLDPEHPYTQGLTVALPLNEVGSRAVREYVNGYVGTLGANLAWLGTSQGPAISFPATSGTASQVLFSKIPKPNPTNVTVLMGISTSQSTGQRPWTIVGSDGNIICPILISGPFWGFAAGSSLRTSGAPMDTSNAMHVVSFINSSLGDLANVDSTFYGQTNIAGAGASATFRLGGDDSGTNLWKGNIAFLYIWGSRQLAFTDQDRQSLAAAPHQMWLPPSPLRRFWFFDTPPTTNPTGTLTLASGVAALALAGSEVFSGTLTLAAGSATVALTGNTETGTLTLAAGSATLALSGSEVFSGTLALASASATIALTGDSETGTLGLAAGAATLSLAGSASGGATSSGVLTLGADTFTLAFSGALALASTTAALSLAGTSWSGSLALASAAASLALTGISDGATGLLALTAAGATLALAGTATINGTLTLKAGSANAPLLHAVAPQVERPAWLDLPLDLVARRSSGVATFVLRSAGGPLAPDLAGTARITLRRAGGATVETVGVLGSVTDSDGNEVAGVTIAWPQGLPVNGLYYGSLVLVGAGGERRVPDDGRMVPVLVGS